MPLPYCLTVVRYGSRYRMACCGYVIPSCYRGTLLDSPYCPWAVALSAASRAEREGRCSKSAASDEDGRSADGHTILLKSLRLIPLSLSHLTSRRRNGLRNHNDSASCFPVVRDLQEGACALIGIAGAAFSRRGCTQADADDYRESREARWCGEKQEKRFRISIACSVWSRSRSPNRKPTPVPVKIEVQNCLVNASKCITTNHTIAVSESTARKIRHNVALILPDAAPPDTERPTSPAPAPQEG